LSAGRIENWNLDMDNLRAAPYFTERADNPNFNRLFAALYDVVFSRLTNMGRLIPSAGRTLKDIFNEKIYGTDKYLVSAELIGYLKWLIYVAAFKDRGGVDHQALYAKYVARLNLPQNRPWRGQLFYVLQAWYDDYQPTKKRKSGGRTTCVIQVNDLAPMRFDDFVDPFEAGPAAAAAAGGAAAAAAGGAAAAAAGGAAAAASAAPPAAAASAAPPAAAAPAAPPAAAAAPPAAAAAGH